MMLNLYKVVIFSIFRIKLRERFDILLSPKNVLISNSFIARKRN